MYAVVNFLGPRSARGGQRYEIALHINHLSLCLRLLDSLLREGRRVAPDKIDEVEAGEPSDETVPRILTFSFLITQLGHRPNKHLPGHESLIS